MEKSASTAVPAPDDSRHIVQFYENEDFLADVAARHFLTGLRNGEPVIASCTETQERLFRERLSSWNAPVERLRIEGALTFLDAEVVLSSFMVGLHPDRDRFLGTVAPLIEGAHRRASKPVRAFGSMVDVLWARGNRRAALELEDLWNELAARIPVTLLCGYGIEHFRGVSDEDGLPEICRRHARSFPADAFADGNGAESRRAAALLGRRARVRQEEAEHRLRLEAALLASRRELQDAVTELALVEAERRELLARLRHAEPHRAQEAPDEPAA